MSDQVTDEWCEQKRNYKRACFSNHFLEDVHADSPYQISNCSNRCAIDY
jgi:hypothetical protein